MTREELEQKICYGQVVEVEHKTLIVTRRDITIGHDIYESRLKIKDIERVQHLKWFGVYRIFSKHIKTKGLFGLETEDKYTERDIDSYENRYRPLTERLNLESIEIKDKEIVDKILKIKDIVIEEI